MRPLVVICARSAKDIPESLVRGSHETIYGVGDARREKRVFCTADKREIAPWTHFDEPFPAKSAFDGRFASTSARVARLATATSHSPLANHLRVAGLLFVDDLKIEADEDNRRARKSDRPVARLSEQTLRLTAF